MRSCWVVAVAVVIVMTATVRGSRPSRTSGLLRNGLRSERLRPTYAGTESVSGQRGQRRPVGGCRSSRAAARRASRRCGATGRAARRCRGWSAPAATRRSTSSSRAVTPRARRLLRYAGLGGLLAGARRRRCPAAAPGRRRRAAPGQPRRTWRRRRGAVRGRGRSLPAAITAGATIRTASAASTGAGSGRWRPRPTRAAPASASPVLPRRRGRWARAGRSHDTRAVSGDVGSAVGRPAGPAGRRTERGVAAAARARWRAHGTGRRRGRRGPGRRGRAGPGDGRRRPSSASPRVSRQQLADHLAARSRVGARTALRPAASLGGGEVTGGVGGSRPQQRQLRAQQLRPAGRARRPRPRGPGRGPPRARHRRGGRYGGPAELASSRPRHSRRSWSVATVEPALPGRAGLVDVGERGAAQVQERGTDQVDLVVVRQGQVERPEPVRARLVGAAGDDGGTADRARACRQARVVDAGAGPRAASCAGSPARTRPRRDLAEAQVGLERASQSSAGTRARRARPIVRTTSPGRHAADPQLQQVDLDEERRSVSASGGPGRAGARRLRASSG